MQMNGEHRIEASREAVWEALNDPDVLKACIPGCEVVKRISETEFSAVVKAKVGPVSAKFDGAVTLADLRPPESYRIIGEGKGSAGFAKGGADVKLTEDGEATLLAYDVEAQVGGKLAQIGSRLIDGAAKKLAGEFFESLSNHVGSGDVAEAEVEAEATAEAEAAEAHHDMPEPIDDPNVGAGVGPGVWVTGLISAVILLLLIFGLG